MGPTDFFASTLFSKCALSVEFDSGLACGCLKHMISMDSVLLRGHSQFEIIELPFC
jgi:hypothetical protein